MPFDIENGSVVRQETFSSEEIYRCSLTQSRGWIRIIAVKLSDLKERSSAAAKM